MIEFQSDLKCWQSWTVVYTVSWMLKGWILWLESSKWTTVLCWATKDSKTAFRLLFLQDGNTKCNSTISARNNCLCFYIAYDTLREAGPDTVLTRFSSINVIPAMLGSPLCSHLTIHHYIIHSSARTGTLGEDVSNTSKPIP